MIYYVEYGCTENNESLVVDAQSYEEAIDYAQQCAEDSYWSYDCNYLDSSEDGSEYEGWSEEEVYEENLEDMRNDIHYSAVPYDEANEWHVECLAEQDNKPFIV